MPAFSVSGFVFVLLKQFFDNLSLYHVHSYSLILSWLSHVILCIYLSRLYFINHSHEEGRLCRGIQEYATHWMWKFNTVQNIGLAMSYEDGGINSTTTIIDKVLLCEKFSWEKYWFWEGIRGIVVSNHSFCTAKNSHSKMLSRSHVLYLLNSYYAIQCKLVHCSLITMINKQIPCILAGWRCSLWLCVTVEFVCRLWVHVSYSGVSKSTDFQHDMVRLPLCALQILDWLSRPMYHIIHIWLKKQAQQKKQCLYSQDQLSVMLNPGAQDNGGGCFCIVKSYNKKNS